MSVPLIFWPISLSLMCYAETTAQKQNEMALFMERNMHK